MKWIPLVLMVLIALGLAVAIAAPSLVAIAMAATTVLIGALVGLIWSRRVIRGTKSDHA